MRAKKGNKWRQKLKVGSNLTVRQSHINVIINLQDNKLYTYLNIANHARKHLVKRPTSRCHLSALL